MRAAFMLLAMMFGMAFSAQAGSNNPVITINPDGSFTVVGEMPVPDTKKEAITAVPEPVSAAPVMLPASKKEHAAVFEAPIQPVIQAPPTPRAKPFPAPVRQAKKNEDSATPMKRASPVQAQPILAEPPPSSGPVTSKDARRIALAIAPPSRSVNVYPADYNGLKVFQVVFKTDSGEQYVLVDRQNGDIVQEKPRSGKKR